MDGGEATLCVNSPSHPTHKNVDQFDVEKIVRVAMWRYSQPIAISHNCSLCVIGVKHEVPANLPEKVKIFKRSFMKG